MTILEYLKTQNNAAKNDFEGHVFSHIWSEMVTQLPDGPHSEDVLMWSPDGSEILCKTEWLAETIANILDRISGDRITTTGYYDPAEDVKDGSVDAYTGWWYVSYDE
jgi:hypothetical protein